jgi:hypothetical protein
MDWPIFGQPDDSGVCQVETLIMRFDQRIPRDGMLQFLDAAYSAGDDGVRIDRAIAGFAICITGCRDGRLKWQENSRRPESLGKSFLRRFIFVI